MKTFNKLYKLALALAVMASFTSCSSDDGSPLPMVQPEPTNAELLANKWFLVKTEDTSTTPSTIVVADDCQQNSYFNFTDDGDIILEIFNLNGSNCESSNIETGTYTLNNDEDQILVMGNGGLQAWPISTLTATELVISLRETDIVYFER